MARNAENAKWHALTARVQRRGDELAARSVLMELGIFARCPVYRTTQEPVLPGYVLAMSDDIAAALRRAAKIDGPLLARYVIPPSLGEVTREEITALEHVAEHGVSAVDLVTPESVPAGRQVRITRGPYAGTVARLARWRGSARTGWRMLVELPGMGRVLVVEMTPDLAKVVRNSAANAQCSI